MTPPEEDPEAREVHENDVIKGEEEEWCFFNKEL